VLLDTWQRRHGGSLHHLSDLRRQSVVDLGELMDEDPPHSAHVARLALELFDATAARHGLGDDSREILEAAALLCNVGMFLSHAQHHKHSYYVIRGTDRLAGFNDDEVERIALVARYHRKSEPKGRHPEYAAVPEDTQREVSVLAGLLRVAIGLDRNHAGRVDRLAVHGDGDPLVITAVPAPGQDIGLELYAAGTRTGLLDAALGVRTEVREGAP
jgi:exopolyphosphatase/guanosine-5'-triphosphate,3'-diphosphate pyrophosphatase